MLPNLSALRLDEPRRPPRRCRPCSKPTPTDVLLEFEDERSLRQAMNENQIQPFIHLQCPDDEDGVERDECEEDEKVPACVICSAPFTVGRDVIALGSGYVYHQDCLSAALRLQPVLRCPTNRNYILTQDEIEELGLTDWTPGNPGPDELQPDDVEDEEEESEDEDEEFMGWVWQSSQPQVAEIKISAATIAGLAMTMMSEEADNNVTDQIPLYLGELTSLVRALAPFAEPPTVLANSEQLTYNLATLNNRLLSRIRNYRMNPANNDVPWVARGDDEVIRAAMRRAYELVRELTPEGVNGRWMMNEVGRIVKVPIPPL